MNNENLLKIESLFYHIIINLHSISFIKKQVEEIKLLIESIPKEVMKLELLDIINTIDSSLSIDIKSDRDKIILKQQKRAGKVLYSVPISNLKKFQEDLEKTNIDDFYFIDHDGIDIILAGSFDFCYYHDVEVKFLQVEFICCPNQIIADKFRIATKEEVLELHQYMRGYENNGLVFCMEDTFTKDKYYIVAHGIEVKWGTVYYYKRDNLQPGERIADWVLKND